MSISILAVETSTNACSASVLIYDQSTQNFNYFSRFEVAPQQHTELLLPMIDEVLTESDRLISQVDVLAFGQGPGSFTGVRIAASVIKAIAYAHDLPVVAVSSLESMAVAAYEEKSAEKIIVMVDARMKEVYLSNCHIKIGDNNLMQINSEEQLLAPDTAYNNVSQQKNFIATGNAWNIYKDKFNALLDDEKQSLLSIEYPNAKQIAYLGLLKFMSGEVQDAISALPIYLRNNVATPKKITKRKFL
ncbi:MAG: tRNA (adenosine(37)-N6)-threonylcarbamoyltransferase complex dimerization subunit type 1 TsaB [Gammaproteobacteria bacterium]|nr:tRNA (adenosine(37)-N6)-threonylcarbamoyltransferase complex dimerization subunit type 1 TsaB [Gammaproteobacteria bacterium]